MAAAKQQDQRKPTRRRGMTKVSRPASRLVSKAIRAKGFAEAEVVTRWGQIVGPELARASVPVQLKFPRGQRMGASLVVRTESAFAPVLQQRAGHVIELVNRYLGYAAVDRLEVKQGPLPKQKVPAPAEKAALSPSEKKKLRDMVGTGELSPLRTALKSLGETVLSNKNKEK